MITNEIPLSEDFKAHCIQLLQNNEKTKEILDAEDFTATILSGFKPSFLTEPCTLLKVAITTETISVTLFALYIAADNEQGAISAEVILLNGSLDSELSFVAHYHERSILEINSITVFEYIRWSLSASIESIEETEEYSPRRHFQSGSFQSEPRTVYYSPVSTETRIKIEQALIENPLTIVNQRDDYIVVRVCVFYYGSLYASTAKVYTEYLPASFGQTESKLAGSLEITLDSSPLITSCLDNYTFPFFDPYYSSSAGEVATQQSSNVPEVCQSEQKLILRDISCQIRPLLSEPVSFKRMYLPLYDMDLLDITANIKGKEERVTLLWKPGKTVTLTTSSNPIHDLNEAIISEIYRTDLITSFEEAAEYTRFFCANVWGDEGPFIVIEDKDDPYLKGSIKEWKEELFGTVDDFNNAIHPLKEAELPRDNMFFLKGVVLYGDGIFFATFAVTANGMIEIIDDEPLADLNEAPEFQKPYNGFENLIPYTQLDTIRADDISRNTLQNKYVIDDHIPNISDIELIKNCRFRNTLDLSNLQIEGGLVLENCVFENGIDFSRASFTGNISIISCTFLQKSTKMNNINIEGNMDIIDSTFQYEIALPQAVITGNLFMKDCSISEAGEDLNATSLTCKSLVLYTLNLNGSLLLSGVTAERMELFVLSIKGALDGNYAVIDTFCNISDIIIGEKLNLYGAVIQQNHLIVNGNVSISGDLDLTFVKSGTAIFIMPSPMRGLIEGDIRANGIETGNLIRFQNLTVKGKIDCKHCKTAKIEFKGSRFTKPEQQQDHAEEYKHDPLTVSDCIDLSHAKIENNVFLFDVIVNPNNENSYDKPGLSLESAEIGNDVRLFVSKSWLERHDYAVTGEDPCVSVFSDGIDFSKAKIGGGIDLSAVKCESGGINLNDASVAHGVDLLDTEAGPATALYVTMNNFQCGGCTTLTGLKILKHTTDNDTLYNGISARYSTFSKGLIISKPINDESKETCARVPWYLDLTGTEIFELSVSNNIFTHLKKEKYSGKQKKPSPLSQFLKAKEENQERRGIILNQATIVKLTSIIYENQYPQPLDLRFADITWWGFQNQKGLHAGEKKDFIAMLNGDPNLQRHTFRSIERNLVNQGFEEAADEIHKEMRKWLRNQPREKSKNPVIDTLFAASSRLKKTALWIWDSLTGSMTSPKPLLGIVAFLLFMSVFVFTNPNNIEPSYEALSAYPDELTAHQNPGPEDWNIVSSVILSIRYHIPVASLISNPSWKPVSNENLILFESSFQGSGIVLYAPFISAEDYANIITLLHWIIWPIIIFLISRKHFRDYEK